MRQFDLIWDRIGERLPGCRIFQTNIVVPPERPLGNLEGGVPYSHSEFFRRINHELAVSRREGVNIVDMEYIASYTGKRLWSCQHHDMWYSTSVQEKKKKEESCGCQSYFWIMIRR